MTTKIKNLITSNYLEGLSKQIIEISLRTECDIFLYHDPKFDELRIVTYDVFLSLQREIDFDSWCKITSIPYAYVAFLRDIYQGVYRAVLPKRISEELEKGFEKIDGWVE